MRTITQRPRQKSLKVKRLTRTGQSVSRRKAIDEILDEVLREKTGKISAAKLLETSRR